ncbi:hypothetical protein B0T24DRAFT_113150 [Lasiosphaeria ovina]|uniref:Uncharacterized protein n=1 Tax=Lasiosphaeria ovina TaxID=92902 RepID=A0AAE0MYJ2_9PEZI|nr:hypothetical protein B0T24DRAFT_113150 [Lasiosphaeria ovina]
MLDLWCFHSSRETNPAKVILAADVLTAEDWLILVEIMTQLEPFNVITKKFESKKPLFPKVIPTNRRLTFAHTRPEARSPTPKPVLDEIFVTEPPSTPRRSQRASQVPRRLYNYELSTPRRTRAGSMKPPDFSIVASLHTPGPEPTPAPEHPLGAESALFIAQSLDRTITKLSKYIKKMETTPVY